MTEGSRPVLVSDERTSADQTPVDAERLRTLAVMTLDGMAVPPQMEVTVMLVDTDRMADLNQEHMGHEGPTDVLAFPLDAVDDTVPDRPAILGDVVLCPAVAAAQAPENDSTPQAEMELLIVHGILHLLGHDHAEPEEERVMFTLTYKLLATFLASNPAPIAESSTAEPSHAQPVPARPSAGQDHT
ncbi:rRNA maturation RNase YbeY [Euzebya tangerina]|uniref:rRNA maturation RNase YbeY n=1 Tax=Euzebya tangerina TaxID=591198 RepID=UPI000E31B31C|nr:rRNA maturation RNase YbeY [Euzebya tangerina]